MLKSCPVQVSLGVLLSGLCLPPRVNLLLLVLDHLEPPIPDASLAEDMKEEGRKGKQRVGVGHRIVLHY